MYFISEIMQVLAFLKNNVIYVAPSNINQNKDMSAVLCLQVPTWIEANTMALHGLFFWVIIVRSHMYRQTTLPTLLRFFPKIIT